jgi:hypothetical protein
MQIFMIQNRSNNLASDLNGEDLTEDEKSLVKASSYGCMQV